MCKIFVDKKIYICYIIFARQKGTLKPNKKNGGKNMVQTVKEFKGWKKIIFEDRAILKADLKYMSWQQIQAIDNLQVIDTEDHETTLIVSRQI